MRSARAAVIEREEAAADERDRVLGAYGGKRSRTGEGCSELAKISTLGDVGRSSQRPIALLLGDPTKIEQRDGLIHGSIVPRKCHR